MNRYDHTNIFSRIIRGEIPCRKVLENDSALAFHDISPAAAVHVLVIPKGEYTSFDDFMSQAPQSAVTAFFASVQQVLETLELHKTGYRLLTNHGAHAHQTVPHFHMHILGGEDLGAGLLVK